MVMARVDPILQLSPRRNVKRWERGRVRSSSTADIRLGSLSPFHSRQPDHAAVRWIIEYASSDSFGPVYVLVPISRRCQLLAAPVRDLMDRCQL